MLLVNIIITICSNNNNKNDSSVNSNNFCSAIEVLWSDEICMLCGKWFKLVHCDNMFINLGLLQEPCHRKTLYKKSDVAIIVHKSNKPTPGEKLHTYNLRRLCDISLTISLTQTYNLNPCPWYLITIFCNKVKKVGSRHVTKIIFWAGEFSWNRGALINIHL